MVNEIGNNDFRGRDVGEGNRICMIGSKNNGMEVFIWMWDIEVEERMW